MKLFSYSNYDNIFVRVTIILAIVIVVGLLIYGAYTLLAGHS
ncbi:hypothetical protein [Panacibacter microcysteis]|nr:hypothetical protein [Panacibacter microcysteis]